MYSSVGAQIKGADFGLPAYGAHPMMPPGLQSSQLMQAAGMGMHTEVLTHLRILLEMVGRHAEEHLTMKRTLEEQVARGKGYQQSIDSLRNQVVDLQEQSSAVAAGLALGGMSVNSQACRGGRTSAMSEQPQTLDESLMEARRGRLRSSAAEATTPPLRDSTSPSDKYGNTPIILSIASVLPAPASLPRMDNGMIHDVAGFSPTADDVAAVVTNPAEASSGGTTWPGAEPHEHDVGFNRSPPGLECPWSRSKSLEVSKDSISKQFKALIGTISTADESACCDVIKRADALTINACDDDGMTVLHYAAMDGRAAICNAVLSHQHFSEVKKGDRNGATALHIAALHDHGDVARDIIASEQSLLSATNRFGDTAHDIVVRRGDSFVCAVFSRAYECR